MWEGKRRGNTLDVRIIVQIQPDMNYYFILLNMLLNKQKIKYETFEIFYQLIDICFILSQLIFWIIWIVKSIMKISPCFDYSFMELIFSSGHTRLALPNHFGPHVLNNIKVRKIGAVHHTIALKSIWNLTIY